MLEDDETRKKLSKVMAMRPSMSDLEKAGVLQTGTKWDPLRCRRVGMLVPMTWPWMLTVLLAYAMPCHAALLPFGGHVQAHWEMAGNRVPGFLVKCIEAIEKHLRFRKAE